MTADLHLIDLHLIDHAARLQIIRTARQLHQLARTIHPATITSIGTLPIAERGIVHDFLFCLQSIDTFACEADRLIDSSPVVAAEAFEYSHPMTGASA